VSGSRTGIGEPGDTPHLAGVVVAGLHGVRLPDGTLGDVLIDAGTVVGTAADTGVTSTQGIVRCNNVNGESTPTILDESTDSKSHR